jgi:hypothetical protein
VVWLKVLLDGSMAYEGASYMSCLEEIAEFLARHPTAKIIIVLDTHCLSENGAFIWKGHSTETYLFCCMKEVCYISIDCGAPNLTRIKIIKDCIPEQIQMYLTSDESKACTHKHKSLILNLACGASISDPESHYSLFKG